MDESDKTRPPAPESERTEQPQPVLKAKNHRDGCQCRMCQMIRLRHEQSLQKPPEKRRLSTKQMRRQAFVKMVADPESPTFANARKSAKAVGLRPEQGSKLLEESQTQRLVVAALERAGITRDHLADALKRGLEATETKLATKDGRFSDTREIADHHARFKFLELAHRLYGDLKQEELVQQAALFVQLPPRELVKGHGEACRCEDCKRAWEELAASSDVNT